MTVLITLDTAGTNSGPFNLYTNLDGYITPFETSVSKSALLAGYTSTTVPNFTAVIRIKSIGACNNYIDVTLSAFPPCDTLGRASNFIILGSSTITNTGSSFLTGDVGLYPGTSITGFPPGIISGVQHIADSSANNAIIDATAAFVCLNNLPTSGTVGADIGGQTITPGIYDTGSSLAITGTLTLDGQGDSNSIFIFKIPSTFIPASGATISLIGNAQPCNVYWLVGSSATLSVGSTTVGNIIAQISITANTNAILTGKAFALTGAVTLDTNTFSNCDCSINPCNIVFTTTTSTTTIAPTTTTTSTIAPTTTTSTTVEPSTTTTTTVAPLMAIPFVPLTTTSTTTNFIPLSCYNFLPTSSYYLLDYVFKPNSSYFYGYFTGYIENDITTSFKNLIKLNPDLTVDTSFNVGVGFNEILYTGSSILEQPDGKIIVTGTFTTYQGVSKNRIVRLNTDASIDTSFVTGTGFNNFTQSPGIDSNGSIIVTGIFSSYNGTSSPRIARLLTNGTIDPSFVIGAGFNNTTTGVLINPDNSMFVLGYFNSYNGTAVSPGITKLLANGSIDTSFVGGTGVFPFAPNNANYFARIEGETSFYVAGYIDTYKGVTVNQIVKLKMNGDIDPSFNTGTGFDGTDIYSINVIWGDKLQIEGTFENYNGTPSYYIIILNSDGSIYFTFDSIYVSPVVIGDALYAAPYNGCLEYLHTFVPTTTTTTTTAALVYVGYEFISNGGGITNGLEIYKNGQYIDGFNYSDYQLRSDFMLGDELKVIVTPGNLPSGTLTINGTLIDTCGPSPDFITYTTIISGNVGIVAETPDALTITSSINYLISDCVTGSFYNLQKTYSMTIGDVIEYKIGVPGLGIKRCGTIVSDTFIGVADASFYSAITRNCGDTLHCPS